MSGLGRPDVVGDCASRGLLIELLLLLLRHAGLT